jgi:type II secretory ATPase GspE/PulE/Tfp pilus assembly ATPase PilB-like protein
MESRKEFESNLDIAKVMEECRRLFIEDNDNLGENANEFIKSKTVEDDFVQNVRMDDDIRMRVMEKISSVVRKRENVISAEQYCEAMRRTNQRQRDLVLEVIHCIFADGERKPLQIFLNGPAGSGKTFTMKMLMETYNRFSQHHNNAFNAYVASASTGMAASAINGTTVHAVWHR